MKYSMQHIVLAFVCGLAIGAWAAFERLGYVPPPEVVIPLETPRAGE